MAQASQLEGRLVAILDPNRRRVAPSRRILGLAILTAAGWVLGLAAVRLQAQAAKVASQTVEADAPVQSGRDRERLTVTGRVLDPDGKPLPDADVIVLITHPRPLTMSAEATRVLAQTRSDSGGRFHLALPRRPVENACMVDTIAYAPGYGAGWHGPVPPDRQEITLRLEPEEPLRVRLTDLEGRHPPE
jgi:hypothetical protein